jgi:hypothetical protein
VKTSSFRKAAVHREHLGREETAAYFNPF